MFHGTCKSKFSKSSETPKVSVFANVFVHKIVFVAYRPSNNTKDVRGNDSENINKTLKTMNACDNPPSENSIYKILIEKYVLEKLVDNPIVDINIENILNENVS